MTRLVFRKLLTKLRGPSFIAAFKTLRDVEGATVSLSDLLAATEQILVFVQQDMHIFGFISSASLNEINLRSLARGRDENEVAKVT